MANVKFTEFPSAATVGSTDIIPIVQGGTNKKATAAVFSTYIGSAFVALTGNQTIAGVKTFSSQLASSVATGTAPFSIASTTKVTNLNADLLDGYTSADFQLALTNPVTGTGTTNYLPKFTGTSALGNSIISESGGYLTLAGTSSGLFMNATNTGTGEFYLQAGAGSASYGASIIMYQNAHATKAGWLVLSTSNTGGSEAKIQFTTDGLGGGSELMALYRDGQIITANATDTGEHFIVGGSARVNGALTANGTLTVNEDGASTKIITIRSNWAGVDPAINVTTNNSLLLMTNNTEQMRITSAGNVGIGTTSPDERLEIKGTTSGVLRLSSTSFSYNLFTNNSDGNFYLRDVTNSANRLVIAPNGNVGIGTTSPSERLSVASTDEYLLSWQRTGDSKRWAFGADSSGTFISNRTDSVLPLFIKNSGNVLIGTITDAGYKLDVNGTARVSGMFTVESTNQVSRFVSTNTALYNTYSANGSDIGYIGNGVGLISGGTATSFGIRAESDLIFAIGNATKFSIANSGAATFSSSVTATNLTLNKASGSYITLQYGGTNDWVFGEDSGEASRNFNIYNFNTSSINLSISRASGAATFSSSVTAGGDIQSNGIYRDYQGEALLNTSTSAITQIGSSGAGTPRTLAFYSGNAESLRLTTTNQVAIGTASPDASAKVQIDSNTQGFLVPRMLESEINSISSPAAGLLVYNTDQNHMCMFDGSVWKKFSMSNM